MPKFIVTDDVQLFASPKEAAQTLAAIPAGSQVESDGVKHIDQGKFNVYNFLQVKFHKFTGFVLSEYCEASGK